VQPNTFLVNVSGTVQILLFQMDAEVTIGVDDGVFLISLDELSLNFFNVLDITVSGFIRSDGQFEIEGEVSIDIDMGIIEFEGGIAVRLADDGFGGRIWARSTFPSTLVFWVRSTKRSPVSKAKSKSTPALLTWDLK
jgi:hypothetical protein